MQSLKFFDYQGNRENASLRQKKKKKNNKDLFSFYPILCTVAVLHLPPICFILLEKSEYSKYPRRVMKKELGTLDMA
jgi:hypothetical protein